MQTKKMSLANIQGKLSRTEMKQIMAGLDDTGGCGTGISCSSKKSGDTCGSKGTCVCDTNGPGSTLYCTSQP